MNFLSVNLLLVYVGACLALVILGMRYANNTRRHRQWLLFSSIAGLGLGPLLLIATDAGEVLQSYSFFSGGLAWVELALLSGLSWAVTSAWPISFKFLPPIPLAVRINWVKLLSFYLFIAFCAWFGDFSRMGAAVVLTGGLGLLTILLAFRDPLLLKFAAVSGVLFFIFSLLVSYLATFLSPQIGQHQLPLTEINLAFTPLASLAVAMLAASSSIVSRWWFGQPLK